jgi:hypothetical protein
VASGNKAAHASSEQEGGAGRRPDGCEIIRDGEIQKIEEQGNVAWFEFAKTHFAFPEAFHEVQVSIAIQE